MKLVVQNVLFAHVEVNSRTVASIQNGLLVFVGFSSNDDINLIPKMVKKLINLRVFDDTEGKTNLSIQDVKGSILSVSQFTLYGSLKDGNRPSFINAMPYEKASGYYDEFNRILQENYDKVQTGIFGADMKITLINNGPATYILDSKELF